MIQQWHSIHSAWKVVEQSEIANNKQYDTVRVLRSNVVFVTPVPIEGYTQGITFLAFARTPCNNQLACGERDDMQIYAAERLEDHMELVNWKHQGLASINPAT